MNDFISDECLHDTFAYDVTMMDVTGCDNKAGLWGALPPRRWYGSTNFSPLLESTSNAPAHIGILKQQRISYQL